MLDICPPDIMVFTTQWAISAQIQPDLTAEALGQNAQIIGANWML